MIAGASPGFLAFMAFIAGVALGIALTVTTWKVGT